MVALSTVGVWDKHGPSGVGVEDCVALHGDSIDAVFIERRRGLDEEARLTMRFDSAQQGSERSRRAMRRSAELWQRRVVESRACLRACATVTVGPACPARARDTGTDDHDGVVRRAVGTVWGYLMRHSHTLSHTHLFPSLFR